MNLLIDAQLPRRLARYLQVQGHNVLHTLDLPHGNATPDSELNRLSVQEQRIVITKDADFVNSFLVIGIPYKLLLVSTGNISNDELIALFANNLTALEHALSNNSYVEMSRTTLIIHL